ncbi:MAG: hypothetical protein FWC56_06240 [Phycisphaerae bacterium]|nr:hypothetical protein [Phycisphaerae bacterium]
MSAPVRRWFAVVAIGAAAIGLRSTWNSLIAADAADHGAGGKNLSAGASGEPIGIRFTPAMARGIAKKIASGLKHYELPDDKMDEATEKIARRLMETAHAMDGRAQEFVQRHIEVMGKDALEGQGNSIIPQEFGKEFADRTLDLLPAIRDFMRNYAQDVRPMLPMKQQLKLGAKIMAFNTGADAFEQTMKKWSSGEITEYNDFTGKEQGQIQKDAAGQSQQLGNARKNAQNELDHFATEWENYAKQFKTYYAIDAVQETTVDSIVREFVQRAEQRKNDAAWRERFYRDQTWMKLLMALPRGIFHPVRVLIEADRKEADAWQVELSEQFKARLESVPTTNQRRAAEERMDALLKEKGIVLEGVNP